MSDNGRFSNGTCPRSVLRSFALCLAAAAGIACERPEPDDQTPDGTADAAPDSTPGAALPPPAAQHDTWTDSGVESGSGAPRLTIYFSRGDSAVAVSREATTGRAGLEPALRELLRGPTPDERAAGIHSWFSDTTRGALRSVSVDGAGRAIVDFSDLRELIPNASTSAGGAMLLRELNATVFAVPSVQSVEFRIEGSCERFWEWLQHDCEVVPRT